MQKVRYDMRTQFRQVYVHACMVWRHFAFNRAIAKPSCMHPTSSWGQKGWDFLPFSLANCLSNVSCKYIPLSDSLCWNASVIQFDYHNHLLGLCRRNIVACILRLLVDSIVFIHYICQEKLKKLQWVDVWADITLLSSDYHAAYDRWKPINACCA